MTTVCVRHNRRGMTLVELLVSVVLLAIALVTVSQMFVGGVISAGKARNVQIATNRALQEIEKAKDMGYLNLVVDTAHFPPPYTIVDSTTVGFAIDTLPDAQGRLVITPYPLPTTENLRRVTATVTWGGSRFTSGSVTVGTLVANRP
jgi:prepilin-type N-terminal cleavage/methylation domain-containing protein